MRKHAFVGVKSIPLIASYVSNIDLVYIAHRRNERTARLQILTRNFGTSLFCPRSVCFALIFIVYLCCRMGLPDCFEKFAFSQKPNNFLLRALIIKEKGG